MAILGEEPYFTEMQYFGITLHGIITSTIFTLYWKVRVHCGMSDIHQSTIN